MTSVPVDPENPFMDDGGSDHSGVSFVLRCLCLSPVNKYWKNRNAVVNMIGNAGGQIVWRNLLDLNPVLNIFHKYCA